jgi:hypothetical protein
MGYSTKSVLFNGTTQYGTAGDVLGFEYNQAFSISFWAKWSTASPMLMLGKIDIPPAWRGYEVYTFATGEIVVALINDNFAGDQIHVQTVTAGFNDNAWHHIAVCYSGSGAATGVSVFVDGSSETTSVLTDALTGTILNSGNFIVGSRTQLDSYFAGNVDEVAIYDKELDATEAERIYNLGNPSDLLNDNAPSNLVWWCRMGENGTATVLTDETGPTGYSPLTTSIQLATGGGGDQSEAPVFPDPLAIPATGQPFTMGVWIKNSGSATNRCMIGKSRTTSGRSWALFAVNVPARVEVSWTDNNYDRNFQSFSPASTILDGSWHHVAWTYDGVSTHQVFVDGSSITAGGGGFESGGLQSSSGGELAVGAIQGATPSQIFYQGRLCHSFLYDKVLSGAEVTAIYNGGVPPDLSLVGPTTNLKHWCANGDGDALGAGNMIDLSGNGNHGTFINGESNDFVADVPVGGYPLTLVNAPTISSDAPEDTSNQFASYHEDPGNVPLHTFQQDTFPQYAFSSYHEDPGNIPLYQWQQSWEWFATFYFRMRGTDTTCPAIQQPAYVYWTVLDNPDWTAAQLDPGELPCGTDPSTDLDDIQIAAAWIEF